MAKKKRAPKIPEDLLQRIIKSMGELQTRLDRLEQKQAASQVVPGRDQPPATGWGMTKDWPEFYWRIMVHEREVVIKWLNDLAEFWAQADGSAHIIHLPRVSVSVLHDTEDDADSSEVALETIFNNFTTNHNGVKTVFIGRAHNGHWLLYSVH